ncbi:MAG: HD-GYP domain-containing protein [Desulfotomaculales bacterium]
MRKVSLGMARQGMKLGRSVYDGQGRVLLQSGVILTESYIRKLKKLGIPAVYVDDGFLPDLQVEDVISEQTRIWAVQQAKELFSSLAPVAKQKPVVATEKATRVINRLLEEIFTNRSAVVNLVDIRSHDEYTFGHSVNVAVLAILTGLSLGYGREKLFQLGIAAIMHDVGKTLIPLNILNKPGALSGDEFTEIQKHTIYGYKIITRDPSLHRLSALVALQHHERYNGEGYPRGLAGEEIHQFAGITGMVDMYDALTSDRIYRKAYPPHEAYEMISGAGNHLFDYRLVSAFLENIAAYPAGSIVKLNSGEVGVVVETKKGRTLAPRVRILFGPEGEPLLEQREIFLAEEEKTWITGVIDDLHELPAYERQNRQK